MRVARFTHVPHVLSRTGLAAAVLTLALVSACGKADKAAPAAAAATA